ncbi:DUF2267 domain-containing protein [Streptomyces malaysiense]|uniref:DUF2267 domain-containing protein n=1 Tax=Streptomyces malaysiense TaxID=1428626 RepID=UPI0030B80F0F
MTMTTTVPKPAPRNTRENPPAPKPAPATARTGPAVRETAPAPVRENPAVPRATVPRTTWETLTEAVRETGGYPTRAQAEHLTRTVLTALGTHLTGDERVALAQSLPPEAGHLIAAQIPLPHPLTAREFVDALSTRLPDSTPATARWDVSSVLTTLSDTIGPALTDQVLSQLPRGYALLFGRAELTVMA